MPNLSLTPEERRRFAEYLLREAHTNEELAKQVALLHVDALVTKYRYDAQAFRHVAEYLTNVEDVEVKGA